MTANILWVGAELLAVLVVFLVSDRLIVTSLHYLDNLPGLGGRLPVRLWQKRLRRDIRWVPLFFALGIIAFNAFLLYQGKDIPETTGALIRRVPTNFWRRLAIGGVQTLAVSVGVIGLLVLSAKTIAWASDHAKRFEKITANDASIEAFFKLLQASIKTSLWLAVAIAATYFCQLPASVSVFLLIVLKIYWIIAAGRLSVRAIVVAVDSLDALSLKYSQQDNWLRFYDRLRHLVPFLKRSLEFIIYVFMAMGVVHQVSAIARLATYGPKIVRIIGIIFLSRVLVEVANLAIEELMLRQQDLTDLQRQRRLTMVPLMQSVTCYTLYFSAGIATLDTLGINPTPILAGAGIVGLAVGFGAQNLINDMVCGFFILFENYYLVGDFVETNQACGWVEGIDLRTTRLRHPDGQVHIIRNGQMEPIVNYSKQYVNAVVKVGVSYDANLDQVYQVLEAVGQHLQQCCADVLSPTRIDGLEAFGESDLLIRTTTQVKPSTHLKTQRLLRKLIKDAFDDAGIEIPFARRVVIFKPDQALDVMAEHLSSTDRP